MNSDDHGVRFSAEISPLSSQFAIFIFQFSIFNSLRLLFFDLDAFARARPVR